MVEALGFGVGTVKFVMLSSLSVVRFVAVSVPM